MKKFDRGSNFGGRREGGFSSRDSRGGGFSRGGQGSGRSEMHQAVCSDCGRTCEVPFRPTGDKPVYCSECFKGKGEGDRRGSGDRGFGRKSSFDEKKMFRATCAECGKSCEVPFRPTGDKPVYCSECFGNSGNSKGKSSRPTGDLEALNVKLDQILKVLNSMVGAQPTKVKEEVKEVKAVAPKKEEKKASKKVSAPKVAAKKKAKKK
jgi:CxxC-x17-CxxC domain-containing protein